MVEELTKVLIVDDEPGHIHWMRKLYERSGLRVFSALSIDEAREILKSQKPHIVTVETYMYNGYWFLQEIRKLDKEVVRVVVTTIGDSDYLNFLKTFGFAEYALSKPFHEKDIQRLEEIILEIASLIRIR